MAHSNSLATIRQYLSAAMGDLILGVFASGNTNTAVHTMLTKGDDYYNEHGFRCYIYAGTNNGNEREISDWVNSTHTLTFDPGYSSSIDVTSSYELHRIFTEDEYRKAINMAINALGERYLLDKIDVATTLVASTYEYFLPDNFNFIHRIITEDTAGSEQFDAGDEIDPRDWDLISPRKLKLDESRCSVSAGKDLRIEGQGRQPTVSADGDIIYLPPDWLVQKAITQLPKSKIMNNSLDDTYKQALILSESEPRAYPHPRARRVVE